MNAKTVAAVLIDIALYDAAILYATILYDTAERFVPYCALKLHECLHDAIPTYSEAYGQLATATGHAKEDDILLQELDESLNIRIESKV